MYESTLWALCDDDLMNMALEFSLDEGGCRENEKGRNEREESYREMEKGK